MIRINNKKCLQDIQSSKTGNKVSYKNRKNKLKQLDRAINNKHWREVVVKSKGLSCFLAGDLETNTYREYLQTDYCKNKRQQILKQRHYKCERCGCKKGLQVHHKTYYRNGVPILYKEADSELTVLCENCHKLEHKIC